MSHRSAAGLWRIETLTPAAKEPLEFIDPHLTLRHESKDLRVHRMPLAQGDAVVWQGLRVTGVRRTLADLLRAGPRDEALVAVDSALTYRRVMGNRRPPLTDTRSLAAALKTNAQGTARARTWLRLSDPQSGSPAETIARLRMYDAGLRPESQVELHTPYGRRFVLDFLFRKEGLAVEIEGYAYHGSRDAHRRDVTRFNQILQCPEVRTLLRYSAEDVFHRPDRMITEIRTTLAATAT
ncbi:endonuclease domain-containing protein [Streptomyces sp. NPDC093591]|uniref:endonuclease domain-containing protein n=1 Tax=Streptomyces sp. NPDC093591 TaxID=3366044 RepID=UPI0038053859